MTREEAIRRIKSWNLDSDDMEAILVVIPELRENEDERTRKSLINFLQSPFVKYNLTDEKVAKWIAYLEKQLSPAEWSDDDNIGWGEALACVTKTEKDAKDEGELQNAVTAEKWLKEIKFKYCVHPQPKQEQSVAERFARIVRGNLLGIDKEVQQKFEQLYFEITGNKMYGGYND